MILVENQMFKMGPAKYFLVRIVYRHKHNMEYLENKQEFDAFVAANKITIITIASGPKDPIANHLLQRMLPFLSTVNVKLATVNVGVLPMMTGMMLYKDGIEMERSVIVHPGVAVTFSSKAKQLANETAA